MIVGMHSWAGMLAQAGAGGMDVWHFLAQTGAALALGLAALGSAIGIGVAGSAAAGAWAKEAKAGTGLRYTYIVLLGMPISQTVYGMIVMNRLRDVLFSSSDLSGQFAGLLLAAGIATGLGELFSAWWQGRVGAAGIRAICEGEGKGFAFMLIAMGIVETVGVFTMVFALGLIPKVT